MTTIPGLVAVDGSAVPGALVAGEDGADGVAGEDGVEGDAAGGLAG